MRVIGGSARGRQLATLQDKTIRPTADRVREALFSILVSKLGSLSGLVVLDLFAGSGALGIEALSRGADRASFVDQSQAALATIRRNLSCCNLTAQAEVFRANALVSLPAELQKRTFGLVFLDPPYGGDRVAKALDIVSRHVSLTEPGLIVAEAASRDQVPPSAGIFEVIDRRKYGSTTLHFFHRIAHEP